MNILIILLGCHISQLLNDRIETAVNMINNLSSSVNSFENEILYSRCSIEQPNVTWFLSGGIKYKDVDAVQKSEAEIMMELIQTYNENANGKLHWNFELDVEATNTAENFIMANRYIVNSNKAHQYDDIYAVTNDFHYTRAKTIADLVNPYNNYNWVLGKAELFDSRRWERIHIKNVESDVSNALNKYKS